MTEQSLKQENASKKTPEKISEWWCIDLGQAVKYPPDALSRFAEACFRFTPDVVVGKNRIFLEMGRTKRFFNLNTVQKRVHVLAKRCELASLSWQWGIGKTLPQSWVQCRWKQQNPQHLSIEAIFDYLEPLQAHELNRRDRERVGLFCALGMRTLQDLFQVPPDAILTRFGPIFEKFSRNFHEGSIFPWNRFVPKLELSERSKWNAEEWVSDAEALIFCIKPLVDRLMSRLFSLRRALKKIEIQLKLDSRAADRVLNLQFSFPQTSVQLFLKILREKLVFEFSREPLTDPVTEVFIRVQESGEREDRSGRFVFGENDSSGVHEGLQERWMELISYLEMDVALEKKIFQAETTEHILPERSWRKVLTSDLPKIESKSTQKIASLHPKRPIRLLPKPLPLSREGMYLKYQNERWKIHEFSCEEHLRGYEWDIEDTGGFDRTYYRVKVENQTLKVVSGSPSLENLNTPLNTSEWWIYKDQFNNLMLHGFY